MDGGMVNSSQPSITFIHQSYMQWLVEVENK
jgi:hypothetical protein